MTWKEGRDKFENSFSIARTEYLLKKVDLDAGTDVDFYLNVCTEKGCSNRGDPCTIQHTKDLQNVDRHSKGTTRTANTAKKQLLLEKYYKIVDF